jgi:hypothetical protein
VSRIYSVLKGKSVALTAHGGPYLGETSRIKLVSMHQNDGYISETEKAISERWRLYLYELPLLLPKSRNSLQILWIHAADVPQIFHGSDYEELCLLGCYAV